MNDHLHILYPIKFSMPRWSNFYERINENIEIDEEIKINWRASIEFLQKELTKGFFDNCGYAHPVYLKLNGGSLGQVIELIKWVRTLKTLKNTESNYPLLLSKLRSKDKSGSEAIPFVDIASRFIRAGFSIYFPKEIQGQKNHDIDVEFLQTNEKICIEVSRINDSAVRANQNDQYNKLLNVCLHYGFDLPFAGKLYHEMDEGTLNEIIGIIKRLKDKSVKGSSLSSHQDPNISIAFSTVNSYQNLLEWCKEHNIEKGFNGFDVSYDDTHRIIDYGRIEKEAKQIPSDVAGLIYFPIHFLYMLSMDRAETIKRFIHVLKQFKNIIGVVLYAEIIPRLNDVEILDESSFIYSVSENEAGIACYTLFVKNPGFNQSMTTEIKNALIKAVTNY